MQLFVIFIAYINYYVYRKYAKHHFGLLISNNVFLFKPVARQLVRAWFLEIDFGCNMHLCATPEA